MTDQPKTPAEEALAEIVANLAEQSGRRLRDSAESGGTRIPKRLDSLMQLLGDAALDEWPTVEELRRLPPAEQSTLVRQLGVFIDRLTALRVELLGGRAPRLL